MTTRAEVGALLQQTAWLRALARSLVSDPLLSDDLVQDAWLAALVRPPQSGGSVRGWLATVLRRRSRELARERERRARREEVAARDEALASVDDVVARAEVQRRLVEAVLALAEPYRTSVLLRFFEELPQREIARRMQTTTATVNSRLTRALDELRERLARGGGRAQWFQVLLPLLREPALAPVALGVGAMKLFLGVAAALSLGVAFALWRSGSEPSRLTLEPPALAHVDAAPLAVPGTESVQSEPAQPEPARRALPDEPRANTSAAPAAPVAPVARLVRGRVLDSTGFALGGVRVALAADERAEPLDSACTSGPGGWFELALAAPADASAAAIVSADPRYATVLAGSARVRGDAQPTVVVAPRVRLAGIVVDEDGAPLAGARLELGLAPDFGSAWGLVPDFTRPQRWSTTSADDGRFELASVPALAEAVLSAMLGGYEPYAETPPAHGDAALVVVLARPRSDEGVVRGVVVDPEGAPVEGARVSARAEIARTGRDGAFVLDLARAGTRPPLIALKRGYEPARLAPELDADGRPSWPRHVVLRLGAPPTSIRGRVVDDDGRPVAGARVWLDDPTVFGQLGKDMVSAESLLRGDERWWSFEVTKTDGTFEIGGLFARPYHVQAMDPILLASADSGPVFPAPAPLELVLATHDVYPRVAGHIVTQSGEPVAGVAVRMMRQTYVVELAEGHQSDALERAPVFSDDDGAFEFASVPKEGVGLIVEGESILFTGTRLVDEKDVEAIEIVVTRRLHLQLELDAPHDRVDALRVLDADGVELILNVMQDEGSLHGPEMPVIDGRSAVISLDDRATTLVLLRGTKVVARLPLSLAPGDPNVVRY